MPVSAKNKTPVFADAALSARAAVVFGSVAYVPIRRVPFVGSPGLRKSTSPAAGRTSFE